ncbi:MAG: NAD(P)-dependent glycerol-3-phosphate dehydrogenase [Oscillospiraceae bacterium]|nr:NAD(P)-dependent glycerol-3-phosphate dehydrogenase [Oscillospiraceae bacterium]
MKTVVLSSGAWGTALAIVLHDNGHAVTLWSHDGAKAAEMERTRQNPRLQGVALPDGICVTGDLAPLRDAELVVFAAPSFALRGVAKLAAPYLNPDALLVSVTKGIERGTHLRMSQILGEETGSTHVVVLSGPSHAEEVARRKPTGCVAASPSREEAEAVQAAFMNDDFRVYTHDDTVGVELSGALKNVAALCCGIVDGCALGDNAKALLMTRALAEIARLAERLGGRSDTIAGLAGMGDLIVTCTSMHSRNRRAGILIGQGKGLEEATREVGAVVEGCYAACSARELSEELGIDMPICRAVYAVLYEGAEVERMARALMRRLPKRESDSCWV